MSGLYDALSVPFGYVLSLLYILFDNYLISLFVLTLLVKLITLPSSISQQKNSAKQARLQPKINRIRQKYSNGGQPTREMQMKIQEETQALYQKEGFSPMSGGCLPLLIQFPIMIGLYGVVYTPLSKVLRIGTDLVNKAASALNVVDPNAAKGGMNRIEIELLSKLTAENMPDFLAPYAEDILKLKDQFMLFGKLDLTQIPDWKSPSILWLIPGLVLVLGLVTSLIMFQKQKQQNPEMAKNPSMGCMTFMSPAMSVWFTFLFPAGVGVYWIMSSFLMLIQTVILNYTHSPQKIIARNMIEETVERRSKEENVKTIKKFEDE